MPGVGEDRPTVTTTSPGSVSTSARSPHSPVIEAPDDILVRHQNPYRFESNRYHSFGGEWPAKSPLRPGLLARHGFFYCRPTNTIQCYQCGAPIGANSVPDNHFIPAHQPLFGANHRTNCAFANDNASDNIPLVDCAGSQRQAPAPHPTTLNGLVNGHNRGSDSDDSGNSSEGNRSSSPPLSSSPPDELMSSSSSNSSSDTTPSPTGPQPPTSALPNGAEPTGAHSPQHQEISDEMLANFRNSDRHIGAVREAMRLEHNRLKSYFIAGQPLWTVAQVSPHDLAHAGFFMLENDRVQCPFCTGVISSWAPGLRPLEEHSKHFPLCPFIMEEDVGNVPIGSDPIRDPQPVTGYDVCGSRDVSPVDEQLQELMTAAHQRSGTPSPQPPPATGAVEHRHSPIDVQSLGIQLYSGPKNPEMGPLESRKQTFGSNQWAQEGVSISTDRLAEAGFFYIGYRDAVKCFHCGGGLAEWEPGDDPWVEHAKMFPECSFLKLNKSASFIQRCQRLASEPSPPGDSHEMPNPLGTDQHVCRVVDQWLADDPVVRQLLNTSIYPRDVIKAVLNERYRSCGQPFPNFAQLYEAVDAIAQPSDGRPDSNSMSTETNNDNQQNVCQSMDSESTGDKPMDTNESQSPESSQTSQTSGDVKRQPQHRAIASRLAPVITTGDTMSSTPNAFTSTTSALAPGSSSSLSATLPTTSTAPTALPPPLPQLKSLSRGSGPPPPSPTSRLQCKICLGSEIEVVFLPCGHQLACTECAQRLTDCPVCRQPIRGFVRTFFS
ncbi:unnamed protein product [Oppiella nova]|uniref:RING-type domain-containing protein n=1 Tax=Oppiella nova TaxID=334625 RepID=A0A7R9QK67_9ACAR|nr:unnamed protein product [Oppiella nova]CAG2166640.1 unnamed protein product [Oppiella nova]